MKNTNRALAFFFLRTLLGTIFLLQGWGKIFKFGIWNLYENAFKPLETMLPKPVLVAVLFFTTFAELVGGAMLLIGWRRDWAYRIFVAVLLIVSIGHGLESPIWDLQHVVFRGALLAALLLLPGDWDIWSLDNWKKRS